ncbi:hypothetical protein [Caulobacter endophyticus]|uniref:Uncharacterized protein n=1 Tax=Caulobacter endophyticus TaxID=2172652 RepID=A0A2T9JI82_9CAUL|nr:hypothetical protein [Caulobacter endophyticus]PVM83388.1 hypothetical protein DDF67_20830 [Caulobacter endophyticus]
MTAYDVTAPGLLELGARRKVQPVAAWPSRGSLVIARPGPGGVFSDVIGCSPRNIIDGYPVCGGLSSYRGWPLEITFSGKDLCRYDELLAGARTLFDRFYLDETDRSPGLSEQRWSPAARPISAVSAP